MRISDWSSDVCSSDLATDVDDLACVLGQWNELGWADEAELWAMPPYQCFETDDVLAARVDDGLKLQLELVARQCPRSEERRVGKECVRTCRSRGSPIT